MFEKEVEDFGACGCALEYWRKHCSNLRCAALCAEMAVEGYAENLGVPLSTSSSTFTSGIESSGIAQDRITNDIAFVHQPRKVFAQVFFGADVAARHVDYELRVVLDVLPEAGDVVLFPLGEGDVGSF